MALDASTNNVVRISDMNQRLRYLFSHPCLENDQLIFWTSLKHSSRLDILHVLDHMTQLTAAAMSQPQSTVSSTTATRLHYPVVQQQNDQNDQMSSFTHSTFTPFNNNHDNNGSSDACRLSFVEQNIEMSPMSQPPGVVTATQSSPPWENNHMPLPVVPVPEKYLSQPLQQPLQQQIIVETIIGSQPPQQRPFKLTKRKKRTTSISYRCSQSYLARRTKKVARSLFPSRKNFAYGVETPKSLFSKLFVQTPWFNSGPDIAHRKCLFEAFWLSLSAFISLLLIGILSRFAMSHVFENRYGIFFPAYGAAVCLFFGNQKANVAQIKNFTWGHIIAGTTAFIIVQSTGIGDNWWVWGALSVSIAHFVMLLTETLNPPSGALAMLFIMSSDAQSIGWWSLLASLLGTYIMMTVAFILNLFKFYKYPAFWRLI